jgi:hypothetical protein
MQTKFSIFTDRQVTYIRVIVYTYTNNPLLPMIHTAQQVIIKSTKAHVYTHSGYVVKMDIAAYLEQVNLEQKQLLVNKLRYQKEERNTRHWLELWQEQSLHNAQLTDEIRQLHEQMQDDYLSDEVYQERLDAGQIEM